MLTRRQALATSVAGLLAACSQPGGGTAESTSAKPLRIGLVAKSLGNNFFNAVQKGGEEAAAELTAAGGKVEVIFTGPPTPTAEGQIEVLNGLIAQRVDAIAVSANDPDALAPTLKKAMERGIKVISYDSAVAADGRIVHLDPSSPPLVGQTCVKMAADSAPNGTGKIAILSATPTSTNQNIWIEEIKRALPSAPGLTVVGTVYGDDVPDKSARETTALLSQHPDLSVIVAISSIAIVAASKVIEDQKKTGKVFITGLGLPSEMAGHVKAGSSKSFALWNPIDLGYTAVSLAAAIARGAAAGPGSTVPAGKMGNITFDAQGVGPMGNPTIFDASNIDKFQAVF